MTPPLPLPVRIAAGLVATAVEQARDLPRQARDLPRYALELPVTAVSQALQASMRLQQKVTELAIKGDRVLGVGPRIEDEPAWATFDDDLPPARAAGRNGHAAEPAPPPARAPRPARTATVTTLRPAADRPAADRPGPDPFDEPGPIDPGSVSPGAAASARPVADADAPAGAGGGQPDDRPATAEDAPDILPGYANLTIPQLRGKLRYLGLDELRALLAWETAHGDRPPFVTMLSNRIATVSENG